MELKRYDFSLDIGANCTCCMKESTHGTWVRFKDITPKTCETCAFWKPGPDHSPRFANKGYCDNGEAQASGVDITAKTFGCIYHEVK